MEPNWVSIMAAVINKLELQLSVEKLETWEFQGTRLRDTLKVLPPEALTSSPSEDWRKILCFSQGRGK